MNAKHRKTLAAIFARPTSATIVFADLESLVKALGGTITEREGSRVKFELKGEQWRCHRPHPGKDAKRYQVEEARELLQRVSIQP
ncbi:MAG TPA: type II toxin-antitoxin system HicA family toxin [Lamprocystis sp. (in: g-proteobacteria)]|nr:type II toxin-antitoxin system HicA family toxin [Lamprocystis sp. (in: g-proteobacteria)]